MKSFLSHLKDLSGSRPAERKRSQDFTLVESGNKRESRIKDSRYPFLEQPTLGDSLSY